MATNTTSLTTTFANAEPAFGSLVQSEWTKLRSIRSTWIMFALAIGLSVAFSAIIAWTTGLTYEDWSAEDQAAFDPITATISGWLFGMVLLVSLSVTTVTSEYGSGLVRTSFIVTPDRTRLFAAKAIVLGLLGLAVTAIAMPGMFLVSQMIYGSYDLETASLMDGDVGKFLVVGVLFQGVLYTLIPFSIAWLLRSTATAITASIGFFFLPVMLAPLLPRAFREHVLRYLPDNAKDSMMGLVKSGSATHIADVPASLIVVVWIAAALAAAAFILERRDV